MSRAVRFAPLALLLVVVAALVWRLAVPSNNEVPSKLEGKPLPAFVLPAVMPGKPGLSSAEMKGKPRLLNIFASWCVPCITEVQVLGELKARGVEIDGVAVRDRPLDVMTFLARNGDPYQRIGSDLQSELQIALGSSGVPESFVIDRQGVIRYQHIGAIEAKDVPLILRKLEEAK